MESLPTWVKEELKFVGDSFERYLFDLRLKIEDLEDENKNLKEKLKAEKKGEEAVESLANLDMFLQEASRIKNEDVSLKYHQSLLSGSLSTTKFEEEVNKNESVSSSLQNENESLPSLQNEIKMCEMLKKKLNNVKQNDEKSNNNNKLKKCEEEKKDQIEINQSEHISFLENEIKILQNEMGLKILKKRNWNMKKKDWNMKKILKFKNQQI